MSEINMQQLKTFVYTVKYKKLKTVAEKMDIKQPTVTFHLKRLEEICGVPLFMSSFQSTRLLKLTEAGTFLYQYASQVLNIIDEVQFAMGDFQDLKMGSLTIGATHTPSTYLLPTYLSTYRATRPNIRLSLNSKPAYIILERIKSYDIDAGILSNVNLDDPDLEYMKLMDNEFVLITPSNHPLAKKDILTIQDLHQVDFIHHETGSNNSEMINKWIDKHQVRLNIIMEISATETMKEAVRQQMGVAIVPKISCMGELNRGEIVAHQIPHFENSRAFYLVYDKKRVQTPALQDFIQLLCNNVSTN